jgi:hypothetical protein
MHLVSAVTLILMLVVPPVGPIGAALFYLGMAAYGVVLLVRPAHWIPCPAE